MKRAMFQIVPRRPQRGERLGPFGRHAPVVASVTLMAFVSTTLHSTWAWAASGEREVVRQTVTPEELAVQSRPSELPLAAANPSNLTEPRRSAASVAADELKARTTAAADPSPALAPLDPSSVPNVALANLPKASAPVAAQAISLPTGAATIGGMGESFTAQLTTGIATLNVPLALPSARGDAKPELSLVYASSGGAGSAGMGWSLGGDLAIARQTDRVAPTYDDRADFHVNQDRFIFGGQELVPICTVVGGSCGGALAGEAFPAWAEAHQYFRSRVEGSFLRFFWAPDHRTWRVQSQGGIHMEFGVPVDGSGDTNALEANAARPREIYRWHLARQYDSHGSPDAIPTPQPASPVVYRYLDDGGVRYLSDIFYTPPASAPLTTDRSQFASHVRVEWQTRPDPYSGYRAGFLQSQRLRLLRVDVTSKPFSNALSSPREVVRRFHVQYVPDLHTSLLQNVQLEGRCANAVSESAAGELPATACPRLPATSFGYQRVAGDAASSPKDANGLAFEPFSAKVQSLGDASPPQSLDEQMVALMDVDADALPDLLVTAPGLYDGAHGLFLNGAKGDVGYGASQRMTVTGVDSVDAGVLTLTNPNVAALDVDGDSRVDLIHMPAVKRYSVFSARKVGTGFSWVGRNVATARDQDPKIDFTRDAKRIARVDVNGDGLLDLVFSSATELQTFFALGRLPEGDGRFGHGEWASTATSSLSTDPIRTCLPWSAEGIRFDDPEVRMADMNGDGLPDIVRLRPGQLLYWPGRGNGFWGTGARDDCAAGTFAQDRHVVVGNPPQFGTAVNGGLELGDINSDGLADLIEVRADAVDIYLNENGERFTARETLSDVPFKPNASRYVQVTDLDGSGTPDLVWGRAYEYQYVDLTGGVQPYLLDHIDNGLGKLTDLEYTSSAKLMLAARKTGHPWTRNLPLSTPIVTRSTVNDQLAAIGRPNGRYVTEYSYADPGYDGLQREFRGFEHAEVRTRGDADTPTVTTRSSFLLGECEASQEDPDLCSEDQSWQDNWREALKGLPVISETLDEQGVYHSTVHHEYELRQLYFGRDGRRVSVAYPVGKKTFAYDTAAFVPSNQSAALPEIQVNLDTIVQTEERSVAVRATAGTISVATTAAFDDFGNMTSQTSGGCGEGCAEADEAITNVVDSGLVPSEASTWLFRTLHEFTTGSDHPAPRHEARYEYETDGDLKRVFSTLSGTLLLDRSHAGGGAIAPPPQDASGGIDAPIEILKAEYVRDAFGNLEQERAPLQRCRSVELDPTYADFAVAETVYAGDVDPDTGCGTLPLTAHASYDRGLSLLLTSDDMTGQPSQFDYDGFGRLTAKFFSDPSAPGTLSAAPASTYEYFPTGDASTTPYSLVVTHEQDGETVDEASYHDSYSYIDGLGRHIAALSEADPVNGDGGDYVVSGFTDYSAKGVPIRQYQAFFWDGDAQQFPLDTAVTTRFTSQQQDAFGRTTFSYRLDGEIAQFVRYHALSADTFDALDLQPGQHQGTFATSVSDGHGRVVEAIERIRPPGSASIEERRQLREYLPAGELLSLTLRTAGSPDVVRWFGYDSLGRVVLNVEPNTSQGFTSDSSTDPATINAIRYAYNDNSELVGTSDARGCGINYFRDAAGRVVGEDYSPCDDTQEPYSAPDFATRTGFEAFFHYDTPDTSLGSIVDAGGNTLNVDTNLYLGRSVSMSDRGTRGVLRYDSRGRITGGAMQVAKPAAQATPADRYAPRWYVLQARLDAAGRVVEGSTGATTPELLGADQKSLVSTSYSQRGIPYQTGSSYGVIVDQLRLDADSLPLSMKLGDGASTERAYAYDTLRRLRSVQTFRGQPELWGDVGYPAATDATQQLLLQDTDFAYDAVGNVQSITDYRPPEDWPASAKPSSKHFEYDDLYRVTSVSSEYGGGADSWRSPYAAENAGTSNEPKPAPHVAFDERVKEQRYQYDYLGNLTRSTDDANGFFDRSMGDETIGDASSGPHQIRAATNRGLSGAAGRRGQLATRYDAAGNLIAMSIQRDGLCLPVSASCWQRFSYTWDEVGRLRIAKRWDLVGGERTANFDPGSAVPARAADVELQNTFDSAGSRVLKTAVASDGTQAHTVYITSTYELRSASWIDGDYELTSRTANVYVTGAGVRGHVVYSEEDLPRLSSGNQHVFLALPDYLGSASLVLDHATGELVEATTYYPYGGTESDYRPARWGSFREHYKFSGKEADVEVGLAYFGARFLVIGLDRWASPDPLAIHRLGGDTNPYSYVGGHVTVAVDARGLEPITLTMIIGAIIVSAAVGAAASSGAYVATQGFHPSKSTWWKGLGICAGIGALSGAATAAAGGTMGWLVGVQVGATGGATFGQALAMGIAGGAAGGATSAAVTGGSSGDILKAAGMGMLTGAALAGLGGLAGAVSTAPTSGATAAGAAEAGSVGEAIGLSAGQAGVAYAYQKITGASDGYAAYAAVSAGVNGAIAGGRGVYDLEQPNGILAAGLDATVGITGTTIGNVMNVVNMTGAWGAKYNADMSARQNRTVYEKGFQMKGGYMLTLGTVSNGYDPNALRDYTPHETVHIWQSRFFGDNYWKIAGAWYVGAGAISPALAPFAGEGVGDAAFGVAYEDSPFEMQAYSLHHIPAAASKMQLFQNPNAK